MYKNFINLFHSFLDVSTFHIVIAFVDKHCILSVLKKIKRTQVMGRNVRVCSMSKMCFHLDLG